LNVAIVARRADALEVLAAELRTARGVAVRTLAIDLASPDAALRIAEVMADVEVGLVIHNAAFAPSGEFLQLSLEDHLRSIAVNATMPVSLAHHFGQAMAARGRGGIVLLSSLTAFQGAPYLATYGATKSFNLSLAEALWFELRGRGVDVLAACPGATVTPNFLRVSPAGAPGQLAPAVVVADALAQLGHGPFTIAGAFNRFASLALRRVLPRRLAVSIMGAQGRKLLP
jgi:short-subunit dehydrogenase